MNESNGTLTEERINSRELSGFGDNIVKVMDDEEGVVCYIGQFDGKDSVMFPKPIPTAAVEAVAELLHRKKMRKALSDHDFDKAQKISNKKFHYGS